MDLTRLVGHTERLIEELDDTLRWRRTGDEPPANGQEVLFYRPSTGTESYDFVAANYFPATYRNFYGAVDGWWYGDDCGIAPYWMPLPHGPGDSNE